MKPEDVHLTDWKRLLIGTTPWWFMLEVLGRAVVLYVAMLVCMRFLGKRLSGQLTIIEMAIMITLGGIVSSPMELPDKGVLMGLLLLVCALGFLRGMGRLGVASERFEIFTHGDTTMLVKDGLLVVAALEAVALSRNALFAALRCKGIVHLGELRRVYSEGDGLYSIVKAESPKPGLPILQEENPEQIGPCEATDGLVACRNCGLVAGEAAEDDRCSRCDQQNWTSAVKS